jgi:peptidoglycan/LPS O-acetylase OafA/YrhL
MTIRGSLYSFSVLLCLPYLSNLHIAPNRLTNIITFTSVVSYSLYLVNLNVVANLIIKLGVLGGEKFEASTNPNWPIYFGLFWVLTFVIGFLNYRFIEVPFLKLRK